MIGLREKSIIISHKTWVAQKKNLELLSNIVLKFTKSCFIWFVSSLGFLSYFFLKIFFLLSSFKNAFFETSLVVQALRFHASNVRVTGLIPGQEIKIPPALEQPSWCTATREPTGHRLCSLQTLEPLNHNHRACLPQAERCLRAARRSRATQLRPHAAKK